MDQNGPGPGPGPELDNNVKSRFRSSTTTPKQFHCESKMKTNMPNAAKIFSGHIFQRTTQKNVGEIVLYNTHKYLYNLIEYLGH